MGGETQIKVSKVLRRQGLHLLVFGFVAGFKRQQPNMPMVEAVRQFKQHFGIHDEDWQDESIIKEIHRMTIEYIAEGV